MMQDNRIHHMDAIEGLRRIDANTVDLVITDPPYNIASKNTTTMQGSKPVSTYQAWGQWDVFHPFDYKLLINQVISEAYRVLRPGGSFYMFTAQEDNGYFIHQAVKRGFVLRRVLAIVRQNPLPSMSKRNWRSGFELCMYLVKPDRECTCSQRGCSRKHRGSLRTFNFLSQQECINVFYYPIGIKKTRHPTEKPQAFIERLVKVSSNPGDLVVDPFVGGGTTAAACQKLGRRYVCFDANADYVEMAQNRVVSIEKEVSNASTNSMVSEGGDSI